MTTELGAKAGMVPPTGPAVADLDVPEWLGVQPGATQMVGHSVDGFTVGTPVLIPEDYVADLSVRLGLYRRIATVVDPVPVDTASGFGASLDGLGRIR